MATAVAKKKASKKTPAPKTKAPKSTLPPREPELDYNKLEFQPTPRQALLCLSQPIDWAEAFRKAAAQANVPLAAWMGEAAKMALPPTVRNKLSVRRSKGRPKPKA